MKHVRFQPSGQEITCRDGETVLSAALREGLVFPYSCRKGNCGVCQARLISGKITPSPAPDEDRGAYSDTGEGILLCQTIPLSDLVIKAHELEALAGIRVRTLSCRVQSLEPLTHNVTALTLGLTEGRGHLEFYAGQYVDLLLWDNRRRSYSIASAPQEADVIEVHVHRIPGGRFSEQEFGTMKEQDLLAIIGPLGTFFLRDDPRPTILIAAGTGFAPISAMLEDLRKRGIQRRIQFYWGVVSRRDLYRHEQICTWEREMGIKFIPVLSAPDSEWDGRCGEVHEAVLADHSDLSDMQVYASGLPEMIAAVRKHFPGMGCAPMHCTVNHLNAQWINPHPVYG